jgi:phasin family protein
MFSFQEQFSAATRANLEAQVAMLTALTNKTFEGFEKVIDLDLHVAKASLEESTATMQQLMAAKDPQEFFSLSTAQAQPNAEKALAYSRHLANIVSKTQAEFTKAAEAQIAETNRKVISLVEELSKNAPAGSENAIALVKSAIGNVNAGYEQLSKTTKQAVEAMEINMNSAADQFAHVATKANGRAASAAKK